MGRQGLYERELVSREGNELQEGTAHNGTRRIVPRGSLPRSLTGVRPPIRRESQAAAVRVRPGPPPRRAAQAGRGSARCSSLGTGSSSRQSRQTTRLRHPEGGVISAILGGRLARQTDLCRRVSLWRRSLLLPPHRWSPADAVLARSGSRQTGYCYANLFLLTAA